MTWRYDGQRHVDCAVRLAACRAGNGAARNGIEPLGQGTAGEQEKGG